MKPDFDGPPCKKCCILYTVRHNHKSTHDTAYSSTLLKTSTVPSFLCVSKLWRKKLRNNTAVMRKRQQTSKSWTMQINLNSCCCPILLVVMICITWCCKKINYHSFFILKTMLQLLLFLFLYIIMQQMLRSDAVLKTTYPNRKFEFGLVDRHPSPAKS